MARFTTLDVSLSSACQLSCDYCPIKTETKVDAKQLLKGISWFVNQFLPVGKDTPSLTINIRGGEPLLELSALKSVLTGIGAFRLAGLRIRVTLKTNMLLLDDDILKYLDERGVEIQAHIDGCEAAHNTFRNAEAISTYGCACDAATKLLQVQPNASVQMTVTPETMNLYADSVKSLYDLGFRNIHPVFPYESMPSESFAELDIEVRNICEWWLLIKTGDQPKISFIENVRQQLTEKPKVCGAGITRCAIDSTDAIQPCYGFIDSDTFWGLDLEDMQKFEGDADALLRKWEDCSDVNCEMNTVCAPSCLVQISKTSITDFCQIQRIYYAEAIRAFCILRERGTLYDDMVDVELPELGPSGEPLFPTSASIDLQQALDLVKDEEPITVEIDTQEVEVEIETPSPTTSTPVSSTPMATEHVPAAERVKDRKTHPFGVPPGTPAPATTDEVFTTVPPKFLVSVVYATREEGEEVYETVKSAIEAATGPIEIIVVDDGSRDESCNEIEALSRTGASVKWIRLETPVGAGMARNIGFAAAKGRVVVSSDAHMRYPVGLWHEIGGFCIEKHAIACPGVAAMFGGPQGWGADLNYHRDGKIGCAYYRTKETSPQRTDGVLGACYFVPREIFDDLTRWPSTMGLWGYEESTINAWAWFHDIPCYCYPKFMTRHLYRSEAAKGTKEPPWGWPPETDLYLNQAANHLALFEPDTYHSVWRPHYIANIAPHQQEVLKALESHMLYETGHWRKNKKHTDYEFFRDVLKVPAVAGKNGSVVKVRPISVILTARNEGKEVANTVRSIVNSGQTRFDIVIVDDASTDGSVPLDLADQIRPKVAKHWRDDLHHRIKIIRHEQPLGVSRSRAEAIDVSDGEMIVIMDAHQRCITKYSLEMLCAAANDKDGIVVASVCNLGNSSSNDPKIRDARTFGARFRTKMKWGLLNSHISTRPDEIIAPRDTVIGAGYAMSKEVLERVGGCPQLPGLWSFFEQVLCLRAWVMDVGCWVHAGVTTEHMYKSGTMDVPHLGTLLNSHYAHYAHFGDESYYGYFKPALLHHGWYPEVDEFLQSQAVQESRAYWAAMKEERGKTDEIFFREMLNYEGEWPPKWKDPE